MSEEYIHPDELIFIQTRVEIDEETVDEYAAMMAAGIEFDPVQAIEDEEGLIYVWDGQHRGEAARRLEQSLRIDIRPGSEEEAEWLALGANQKHGLRRSREDKQFVVRQALLHPNGAQTSDREIARHCGVDHKTVGRIRSEMEAFGEIPEITERTVTRSGVTYQQETAGIGHGESAETDDDFGGQSPLEDDGTGDIFDDEDNVGLQENKSGQDRSTLGRQSRSASSSNGRPGPAALEQATANLPAQPQQRELKFAQVNQGGVALEVTIYVDGEAHNVPVTAMFAQGPVAGLPEMSLAGQQQAALILPYELGKQMRLAYLDNLLD